MNTGERIIIDATRSRVLLVVDDAGRLEAKPWGGDVPRELVHRLREHREDVVGTLQGESNGQMDIPLPFHGESKSHVGPAFEPHELEGESNSQMPIPLPPEGRKRGSIIQTNIPSPSEGIHTESKSESAIPFEPHELQGGSKSNNGLPSPHDGRMNGGNSSHSGIPSTPHSVENYPQQHAQKTVDTRDSERSSTGVDTVDARQTHASQLQNAAFVTASQKFSTTEGFSTSASNRKPASDLEPAETDEQRRDRHQREQQEAAAEGDAAFWETSARIRRERAEHGNPFAVEAVEGGACRAVLDTFADLWEVEPQDAEEALAIWEEQTNRDALTGAAK